MLSFFERRLNPYPEQDVATPPKGFFAFIWACTKNSRGWIGLMTVTSIGLSAYEAMLFALLSFIVDWLPSIEPA
ncbi:multidrug ABC transporter ATP-binding protein, partial [Alcaligenes pakistanensis]